ncbi:ABC transporter substrate-binding protein [Microbacterium ulmi]|uniref:Extracellular solute-binding protein n=1 Tax=Microbacterium ulmi TaxID=179095 RepID=A0A7Y2Q2H7_9MICO|nr:extracellular solute-binding protein [Microbacterium ulmi]NII69053.1 multiple sugar transport system substrate-binding protein [Microbacterium ulmi]NNH04633.1 extracellular solute-binding protein [Microbacterium ulmi]
MTRTARSLAGKASLGVVLVGALALAGCAGGTTPSDTESPEAWDPHAQKAQIEIAWWGNEERAALFQQVIDAFEEEYPEITVTGNSYGAPDDLFNRLATDFGGGGTTAPDVFALGGAKPQEYGSNGLLLQLDAGDQIETISNSKLYPDFSLTNAIVDDKLYGLPTGGNATAAFVNTKIFEEAGVAVPDDGWTWDDLVEAANEIGSKHLTTDTGAPIMGIDLRIQDILGTYTGQETEFGMYDWDGNLAVGADVIADWYTIEEDLLEGGGLPDPTVVTTNWNLPTDQQPYTLGQAAITFGYSNLVNGPYGLDGATKILTPPTNTDKSGVALLPSAFWSVNAATKYPEAAALLMDWFLSPEAADLIKDTRGVPFRDDTASAVIPTLTGGAATAAEYVQSVLDSGEVAPPQPNGGANMNSHSQTYEAEVLFGRQTPKEAADNWVAALKADLEAAK